MYICTTNVCVCVCVCVRVRVRVNVSTCRKFTLKCIMYIFVILFHHFVPFHILTSVQSIFVCLYLTRGTTVALLLCANCNCYNNSNSENCPFVLNSVVISEAGKIDAYVLYVCMQCAYIIL